MAYIGHPVAGDEVYGPRKTLERTGNFSMPRRRFHQLRTGERWNLLLDIPNIFVRDLEKISEITKKGLN